MAYVTEIIVPCSDKTNYRLYPAILNEIAQKTGMSAAQAIEQILVMIHDFGGGFRLNAPPDNALLEEKESYKAAYKKYENHNLCLHAPSFYDTDKPWLKDLAFALAYAGIKSNMPGFGENEFLFHQKASTYPNHGGFQKKALDGPAEAIENFAHHVQIMAEIAFPASDTQTGKMPVCAAETAYDSSGEENMSEIHKWMLQTRFKRYAPFPNWWADNPGSTQKFLADIAEVLKMHRFAEPVNFAARSANNESKLGL